MCTSLRGGLGRWLIEITAGVFVGRVSKLVREALWERCLERSQGRDNTILQIWRANNEQGFDLRYHNPKGRVPMQVEGIWLSQVVDPDPRREP